MQRTFALLVAAGAVLAKPMPAGVSSAISPSGSAPAGCSSTFPGTFEITVVNVTTAKRDLSKRQASGTLTISLTNGVMTDQDGRTGYIAANDQFQFDNPPQAGAIYTAGWSVCANDSVALGSSAIFYQCLSGSFYNLYDVSQGGQCSPIYIEAITGSSPPAPSSAGTTVATSVSQLSDGQPQATTIVTQISDGQPQAITQISDGQPQAPTPCPASQISDGQPQECTSSAVPVSQISDGQPQATTAPAVSQISDGQPQATTGPAVSQISDGQPQATTGPAVSQISDGQPQATTGAVVTQISDGQPQATTAVAPITQISDGQPQATTGAVVSQISDGQPQASTAIATFTGAAAPQQTFGALAFAAGVVGAVAML